MVFRRFKKRFEHVHAELGRVTYPRGWAGEVDADLAKLADENGATLLEHGSKAQPAAGKPDAARRPKAPRKPKGEGGQNEASEARLAAEAAVAAAQLELDTSRLVARDAPADADAELLQDAVSAAEDLLAEAQAALAALGD